MQATAQRFSELHPGSEVLWEKRSLQQFADAPLASLAARFDLMVIDHPSIGEAAHQELLLPLDEFLPPDFLDDQAANSVGASHASYHYGGHQWALAIDAATPVSSWREDLIAKDELPQTWDDLLRLARSGKVIVPAIPIDSLMNFFMLANAHGATPFASLDTVVQDHTVGAEALARLRELVLLAAPGSLERNPIRTYEAMTTSDIAAYCPFAYGYSNYAREGYAAKRLRFGGLVSFGGSTLRSTLGGAGLAISRHCRNPELAVAYAQTVACAETQRTIYMFAGGQPGHRAAWTDEALNEHAHGYFRDTLPALDAGWVRPRFPGFIAFQDEASVLVHRYLVDGGSERAVLDAMDAALAQHYKQGDAA